MVLLTASTISAAISGVVICLFTFLLFLSGYVLQQQSVRSLREALEAPVEVRLRIQPTLPPQFQHPGEDVLEALGEDNDTAKDIFAPEVVEGGSVAQVAIGGTQGQEPEKKPRTPQELWHEHIENTAAQDTPEDASIPSQTTTSLADYALSGRFAYTLSLTSPSDLCSALLFTKWHRQTSHLPQSQVNIIFLYPADWETTATTNPIFTDALRLLLQSEHQYAVLLHPVPISKVWVGIDVESQLLSELARNPWPYDRLVHLRTPGMLLDTNKLDSTLVSTYAEPGLLKTTWARLRAPSKRGGVESLPPDVLLFAQGRGLMTPLGELQRTLTAKVSHAQDDINDGAGTFAKDAAYVLFDEKELEHRKKEKIVSEGIFERFEWERRSVCEGTSLMS